MTAALGVILDHKANTQRFFGGTEVTRDNNFSCHTDEITCLSVSSDRTTAVSGQHPDPQIFAWDALTGEKILRLPLKQSAVGIQCVAISYDCQYLAAVDMSDDHTLCVVEVQSGNFVWTIHGDSNKIYDVAFSQKPGSDEICTVGTNHVCFWHYET